MAKPFNRQAHKMVKPTQTIRRQQPANSLSAFDHFGELALKALIRLRKHGSSTNIVTFTFSKVKKLD